MLQVPWLIDGWQIGQVGWLGRKVDDIELLGFDVAIGNRYFRHLGTQLVPNEAKRRNWPKQFLEGGGLRRWDCCQAAGTINIRCKPTLHLLANYKSIFLIWDLRVGECFGQSEHRCTDTLTRVFDSAI